jgi:hypothetical protein
VLKSIEPRPGLSRFHNWALISFNFQHSLTPYAIVRTLEKVEGAEGVLISDKANSPQSCGSPGWDLREKQAFPESDMSVDISRLPLGRSG